MLHRNMCVCVSKFKNPVPRLTHTVLKCVCLGFTGSLFKGNQDLFRKILKYLL